MPTGNRCSVHELSLWGCPQVGLRAHSRAEIRAVQQERPKFIGQLTGFAEGSVVMDYDKMKSLMETSREESTAQRKPQVKEFPKPDSRPDWKYLDHIAKERMAA